MIVGSMSNDIYMQIALIMLMGLLAKNAILIVEFALDRRKYGYEYYVGSRTGCRSPSASYLDDLIGDGGRIDCRMMFAFGAGAQW